MSINSLNSSMVRLSGMSSGLDTDAIVSSILTVAKAKLDKQSQTTIKLEWKADALREVNSLLRTFRESNLSVLNASSNMLSSAAYNTYAVTMLSSTNAVTVSAGSNANAGVLTINNISKLASSATLKSQDAFKGDSMKLDTALKELNMTNKFTFDDEGILSFSINGETFEFNEDASLNHVLNAVNTSGAGVRMSYSSLTKGFTIIEKTTGSASTIEIENLKGNAFAENAEDSAFGIATGIEPGKDAILTIENRPVTKSSNTFTIDGITYTLNAETNTEVSFSVNRDVSATVDKIASFVDSYNKLIDKLQGLTDEKTYRNYPPLTDEQKTTLNETEIKLWEEKAKSGLLRSDSSITSLLSTIRSAFFSAVEGTGMSPSQLGLSTGAYYEKGKITVDKDKLRTAIENNPDAVRDVFIKTSSSSDKSEAFKESGLIVRISNALLNYTSQATSNTLTGIDKQISDSKKAVDALNQKMATKESALWRKFTAMEKALSTLNSQSGWLSTLTSSWQSK